MLCDSLEGKGLVDVCFGLFLVVFWCIGKSMFLCEDLVLEVECCKWIVIYVDLWVDCVCDFGLLIVDVIKFKLV